MTLRSRQVDMRTFLSGSYYNHLADPQIVNNAAAVGIRKWCDDTVGHRDEDHSLRIRQTLVAVPRLNGEYWGIWDGVWTKIRAFDNYPIDYQPEPENSESYFGIFGPTDYANYTTTILAKSNPSVAHVSVPTSIGELKDLPSLIQGWGRNLLKQVAKGYISWRWAVKPMVSDIRKLFQFQDAVDERFRWLKKLQAKEVLRRRVKLGEDAVTTRTYQTVQSNGCYITNWKEVLYTQKVWGTSRWKLRGDNVLPDTSTNAYEYAKKLTYGITSYEALNTAWELLPWSWLVDWFWNVGGYISSMNNTLPLDCVSVCLMRRTTSRSTYTPRSSDSEWVTLSGAQSEVEERKLRYILTSFIVLGNLPPLPCMPCLTARHWSILGALAVLRSGSRGNAG